MDRCDYFVYFASDTPAPQPSHSEDCHPKSRSAQDGVSSTATLWLRLAGQGWVKLQGGGPVVIYGDTSKFDVNTPSKKSFPDLDFSPSNRDLSGSAPKRNALCLNQHNYVKI